MMNWQRKILIGIGSFILLLLLLNFGFNLWIKYQLPKIINGKNGSAYAITYKRIEVSLLSSNILASDVTIVPKAVLQDTLVKAGIYARIPSIEIRKFKLWSALFSDRIKARSITVESPRVILYKRNDKAISHSKSIRSAVVAPFEKIIAVSDIFLYHGDLKIINVNNDKAVLSVQNVNLQLDGIVITDDLLEHKIPFQFRNYSISYDSLYYRPNEFYNIRTRKFKATKTDVSIAQFTMIPQYSRAAFVAKIPKEKDLYTLLCDSIDIANIDWGFKESDFFFHCDAVVLNRVSANIYRSKEPTDDLSKKHLYNKLLRELKFDLKVDTLKVRNSIVAYEEEKSSEFGAGQLTFNSFNLSANHICSGFKKQQLADVKIKINCRFMNDSSLAVDWKFNVMDKSDGFNIKGKLSNFDVQKMTAFSKPYLNVSTKGTMDEVYFNFTGNDQRNAGDFAVKYDDLKFTIYKKDDRKKKNKLLTFVANIFVKKDTKGRVKDANIAVERIPEKSFYNLLWRSVAEGLKKILV